MKDEKIFTVYPQNTVEALPYIVQALFLAPGIKICMCLFSQLTVKWMYVDVPLSSKL